MTTALSFTIRVTGSREVATGKLNDIVESLVAIGYKVDQNDWRNVIMSEGVPQPLEHKDFSSDNPMPVRGGYDAVPGFDRTDGDDGRNTHWVNRDTGPWHGMRDY